MGPYHIISLVAQVDQVQTQHYMVHTPHNLFLFFFLLSLPPNHITQSGWDQIQLAWMYIISKLKSNLQPCPQWDTQFTTPVTKAHCYGYNNQKYRFPKGYFWSTFCIFRKFYKKTLLCHMQASCSIQPFFFFLRPIHYTDLEAKKKKLYFPWKNQNCSCLWKNNSMTRGLQINVIQIST